LQQAVYELATVRPFLPERCAYTIAELEIYGRGYYQALAAALRVMKPAAKRWEGRMKQNDRPHLVGAAAETRSPAPASPESPDPWLRPLLIAIVIGAAMFLGELIVYVGVLIAQAVQ
jgi:hypothetical protein